MDVINQVIGDTSAIVALLRQNERYHEWASDILRAAPKPILTCEAVIAESCFLLGSHRGGEKAVLDRVADGILKIEFSISAEVERVIKLMSEYSDLPMSFADACLVRMSESIPASAIFTLDSDFLIYRKHGKNEIPLIMPK